MVIQNDLINSNHHLSLKTESANNPKRIKFDPIVSIIVTSFNQAGTIEQTFDSILNQNCGPVYEIIIGEDFSSDNTREICNEYLNKYPGVFIPLFHKRNVGVGANFAMCMKQAIGKYIAICAADDYWHNSDKLKLQIDFLEKNPQIGLVYTDYDKLDLKSGRIIKNYIKSTGKEIFEGPGLMKAFFEGKVPVLTLTVMFRKELFDKFIPADDYIKYHFPLEDWPTWLILSRYTKIGYLPISTGTYRFGHESITNPVNYKRIEERLKLEQIMYRYICEMFPEDLSYNETHYLIYVNHILLNLAFKKMDYKAALKYSERMKNLGSISLKVRIVGCKSAFFIFSFLKRLRNNYFSHWNNKCSQ